MENILLFGTGKIAKEVLPGLIHNNKALGYTIIGMLDNDPQKYGEFFYQYKVYHPGELYKLKYSKIIICCDSEEVIRSQLIKGYGIAETKIENRYFLLEMIMKNKYKASQDTDIQSILNYWDQGNQISVFNNFIEVKKETYHEVKWESSNNLPYILFETIDGMMKRMYFPREYQFALIDGKQVMVNLMYEQTVKSPHLYINTNHNIVEGDIVVDAGVCEGNFALKYINLAKKIYLFECDPYWQEALYYTFQDSIDKVKIIGKFVSNRTGGQSVKIDDVVDEKINFLKMDIEGAEIEGLLGAKETLQHSDAKCSICSYHRHGDEQAITGILSSYGYRTSASNGYMTFLYDPDFFYHLDCRRGIVYGTR
jgi:hypothetical protein